jgi:hypothetical protein
MSLTLVRTRGPRFDPGTNQTFCFRHSPQSSFTPYLQLFFRWSMAGFGLTCEFHPLPNFWRSYFEKGLASTTIRGILMLFRCKAGHKFTLITLFLCGPSTGYIPRKDTWSYASFIGADDFAMSIAQGSSTRTDRQSLSRELDTSQE